MIVKRINEKTVVIVEDVDGSFGTWPKQWAVCGSYIDVLISAKRKFYDECIHDCLAPCLREDAQIILL